MKSPVVRGQHQKMTALHKAASGSEDDVQERRFRNVVDYHWGGHCFSRLNYPSAFIHQQDWKVRKRPVGL